MARKTGIPAREIQGFAISNNDKLKPLSLSKDVLHVWPEYFNKQNNTWTQIDPTWTNTTSGVNYFDKLDLNHIAFVIHGDKLNDTLPAGFYKNPNKTSKDIQITTTAPINFPTANISINLKEQKNNTLILNIDNPTGVAIKSNITSSISTSSQQTQPIYIPPLSHQTINIKLQSQPIIGKTITHAQITIANQHFSLPIEIKPILQTHHLIGIGIILTILIVSLQRRIKKNKLTFPIQL